MITDGYVVIREIDLPYGVHGMTKEDPDGVMNIYIRQQDPEEEQQKTVLHEMNHITMGHFGSGRDVEDMEAEADAI